MGKLLTRRLWLKQAGSILPVVLLNRILPVTGKVKTIMIVSGWQDINIGDIAHTPGLLKILETYLPEARIILWKKSSGKEVGQLLQKNFPAVRIIYGNPDEKSIGENKELREAFSESDILIHGSGPSIVGKLHLEAWVRITGKPFGIFGTTIQSPDDSLIQLLKKARFVLTRETASLEVLEKQGIKGKDIFFVPDATFNFDLKDETKGIAFLRDRSLEEKKFICVVPRLRRTPYYLVNPKNYSPEQVKAIDDLNNSKKETDHAKLREAMISWVRNTGQKVLVCPEMTYQVDIMDELLINPLPEDVKPFVQKRGYWFPDEAASVYSKAFAVLSFECHSPIIALANSTPAFYLRQPEDTIKGQMYYDLDLSDWIFEIENTKGSQISEKLMTLVRDPALLVRN
jgi:Polysaccharide pyruvyl transferase